MNEFKKVVKNFGLFSIGTLTSKLITMILVPIYTFFLTTEEYGQVDFILNLIYIIIPIVSLNIVEGVFRFTFDDEYEKEKILTTSTIFNSTTIIILWAILKVFFNKNIYIKIDSIMIIIFIQTLEMIFKQYSRASSNIKAFIVSDIINALIMGVLSILFISKYNMGINGYLLAVIIAYIFDSSILIVWCKIYKKISFRYFDFNYLKMMLKYSVPTVPNGIMLWIISISDRFFISNFLGYGFNGIYSVASRFSSMINLINGIFFKAFQISAIENIKYQDSSYYNRIMKIYVNFLIYISFIFTLVIKPVSIYFLNSGYNEVWKYSIILFVGSIFGCFSNFLSVIFISNKNTKLLSISSFIGGVTNLILNYILINNYKLYGACIATLVSYVIMFFIRYHNAKSIINIKIHYLSLGINLGILFIQILSLNFIANIYLQIIVSFVLFPIISIFNFKELKNTIKYVKKRR